MVFQQFLWESFRLSHLDEWLRYLMSVIADKTNNKATTEMCPISWKLNLTRKLNIFAKKETLQNPTTNQRKKANQNTNTQEKLFKYYMLEMLFIFIKAFNKNLNWITVAMEETFRSWGVWRVKLSSESPPEGAAEVRAKLRQEN